MKKQYTLFFSILFTAASAFSQDKLSPETLWKFDRVDGAFLNPAFTHVIYGVRNYDVATNKGTNILYSIPVIGGNPKAITTAEDNAWGAKYTSEGKRIGFMSAKGGESQLWEMNPDGTGKRQVTNIEGGIGGFKYSPDGKMLLFFRDVKMDKTITELYPDLPLVKAKIVDALGYRHWDQWEDESYSHPFYVKYDGGIIMGQPVDMMDGQHFESPMQPFGGEEQLCWSNDSKSIIYTCKKVGGTVGAYSTNSDLFRFDLATGVTTNLTDGMPGYDQDPQLSSDGRRLFWLSMERAGYESDKSRLMVYDFEMKQTTELTASLDRTVESFCLDKEGYVLYLIVVDEGCKQLYRYDLTKKKMEQITKGTNDYLSVAWIDRKTLLAAKQSMSSPTELYTVNINNGEDMKITNTNAKLLSTLKMGKVERRMVKTTDNLNMLVWVIYPPDFDKNKKYPTLLYCQGGPQSPVSQFFSYRWNFQLMAANGYIVVAPNRRGLQGFGKEWNDQIIGNYGGQCMNDYLSAIDDVAKEKYVNKDKLGCVGASFGGYSVYYLAGHHQKRFKAFVSHCGMYNMDSWYGTTEEMFFAKNDQIGPPWNNEPNYKMFSPHNFVKSWDSPILIIHNEKDFRVPLGQGMEAFTAAQTLNIPSRFLYFPDENHWVNKPQNSILWQRVYFEWLDKWLK
ncbi:MAG: S9 family peptidase [Flavobacteriaceae bacterium]|nr:S9 family peptidase [Flavobacteriaceae bacterium]